jgi:opacity protein-like surface antigen
MRKTILLTAALLLLPTFADAQVRTAPRTWFVGFGQMYTNIARVQDPGRATETASDWIFDDNAFGFGLGLQREVGQGLLLGVEGTWARAAYERRLPGSSVPVALASGDADIVTGMFTGRFAYGGGSELGLYLTGGLGTVAYRLEDIGEWNADFALRAGTGLEYRFARSRAAFLEWGRIWGYHERDGVGGGSAQHGALKLGVRLAR